MDVVKIYSNMIKRNLSKPKVAQGFLHTGLYLGEKFVKLFPNKRIPQSLQYLNWTCFQNIRKPLSNQENSVWVNAFAPTELLHAIDVYPLFIEAYSSFMSGFYIEDSLVDLAETRGIANTLCSFHKIFLGAGEAGILPKPKMAFTTSMVCDANINTFRYLTNKYQVPLFAIDIPSKYSQESVMYVKNQLLELKEIIEDNFSRKIELNKLRKILQRENQTNLLRKEYMSYLSKRALPNALVYEMYMMFTSHVFMGTEETLRFYSLLLNDIKKAPPKTGPSLFFIQLLPFYEPNFKRLLDYSSDYHILGCDLNYDYLEPIDLEDPYEGLAQKLIKNIYNGSFANRIESISKIIETIKPDGAIQFCHWGCKQSIGGINLLKDALEQKGIPFLAVDGDIVDKRNNQEGQINTRLEAFLEMIEKI
jgi:benzoyl-CoA reductase/2-hydroxyglutaryl-CoA dehydratase subunit BcrC/BadD/HgdB